MSSPVCTLAGLRSAPDVRRLAPTCHASLTIYPHRSPVTSRSSAARTLSWSGGREPSIIGAQWQKSIGAPAGQWSVTLKPTSTSKDFASEVDDGDWAELAVLRSGQQWTLARGPVLVVREPSRAAPGGGTSRTITISGTDHGGLATRPLAWTNLHIQSLRELSLGLFCDRVNGEVGGAPDAVFTTLINAAFQAGNSVSSSAWELPLSLRQVAGAATVGDMLEVTSESTRGAIYNESGLWTAPGQTLAQALDSWCNPLLNEMRWDIGASGPFAAIRERPFLETVRGTTGPWGSLRTWHIPDWILEGTDLGRSGDERFTIFEVMADMAWGSGSEQTALSPPLWASNLVQTHGIRPYTESTRFLAASQGAAGWVNERSVWQRLVCDWTAPVPYLLSGTLQSRLILPEVQAGDKIVVDGSGGVDLQAYVEQVAHSWQWSAAGPRSSTALTVTHGFRGTDSQHMDLVRKVSNEYKEAL